MSVMALKKLLFAGGSSSPDSSGSGGGVSPAVLKGVVENALMIQRSSKSPQLFKEIEHHIMAIKNYSAITKKIMKLINSESRYERNTRLLAKANSFFAAGDLKEAERIAELLDPEFSKQIFIKLFKSYFRRKDYKEAKRIAFLIPSLTRRLEKLELLFESTKDSEVGKRIHELRGRSLSGGICFGTAVQMMRRSEKEKAFGGSLEATIEGKARFLQALNKISFMAGLFNQTFGLHLKKPREMKDNNIIGMINKAERCILRLSNKNSRGTHAIFIYQDKETGEYFFMDSELVNKEGFALIRRFSSKKDLEKALIYHLMNNYKFNRISRYIEISSKGLKPRSSNFLSERFNMTEENLYNLIKQAIEAKQKDKVKALVKIANINGIYFPPDLTNEELRETIQGRLLTLEDLRNDLANQEEENEGVEACRGKGKRSTNPHARRGL